MATARKGRELFTILETSADAESSTACDSQDSPLNLSADVKWFEIPYRKPDSDEEDELREEEEEDDDDDGGGGGEGENGFTGAAAAAAAAETADAASFIAGGGCNIILVTGSNGIKHDEEEYAEDCYYSTSTNCSDTTSNDSDIDFSDLEEEERRSFFSFQDDLDDDCTSPDFWGEPDQVIAIEPFSAVSGPQHSLGDDADTRDYFPTPLPASLFPHPAEPPHNYAPYPPPRRRNKQIRPLSAKEEWKIRPPLAPH